MYIIHIVHTRHTHLMTWSFGSWIYKRTNILFIVKVHRLFIFWCFFFLFFSFHRTINWIFSLEITKQSFVYVNVSIDSHQIHQVHVNKLNIDGCFNLCKAVQSFVTSVACLNILEIKAFLDLTLIHCIVSKTNK